MWGKKKTIVLFSVLYLVNLLIIFFFYQTKPTFTVNVGSRGDYWFIQGFYDQEKSELGSYRWSRAQSSVLLPVVGSPYDINVQAASYRPDGTPLPQFSLNWNNSSLTENFQATSSPMEYRLKGKGRPDFQLEQGTLIISTTDLYKPKNDNRELGILVQKISIQAHSNSLGFVLPPICPWLALSLGLLALQGWFFAFSARYYPWLFRNRKLLGIGLLVPPIIMQLTILFAPGLLLEAGFSLGGGLLALGLAAWLLLRLEEGGVIWVGLIMALVTYAVFYNLFNYLAPFVLAVGLIPLVVFYNKRFSMTRFNLLLVGSATIFACWGLLQQRAVHTHDGEFFHYYWLNEFDLLIREGNIYPRWAAHFSFGHGSTIFNFYAPLARYLAEIFRLFQLPPAFAYQAYLCLVTLASGISLYFLARKIVSAPGALVAAVAYIYHPFRLSEIYMRGDMAEVLNFVFIPLVLLACLKILAALDKRALLPALAGAVAVALAIISHPLSAFFYGLFLVAPFLLFNLFFYFKKDWSKPKGNLAVALKNLAIRSAWLSLLPLLGLGLAAFYALPVLFESRYIQLSTVGKFEPEIGLLNFNGSNWKELIPTLQVSGNERLNINNLSWIGIMQLLLAAIGAIIAFLPLSSFTKMQRQHTLALSLCGIFLLLMQLPFTSSFWQHFPGIALIQFSWRLMMFVALVAALLIGFLVAGLVRIVEKLAVRWEKNWPVVVDGASIVTVFLLCLVVAYGGAGRIEITYQPPGFTGEYSLKTLTNQIEHGDYFYLPLWANTADLIAKEPSKYEAAYIERNKIRQPDVVLLNQLGSTHYLIEANLKEPGLLVVPIFYFEGWTLTSNQQKIPISYSSPDGFITAQLPAGKQNLELQLQNSELQSFSNLISLLSLGLCLGLFWREKQSRPLSRPQSANE